MGAADAPLGTSAWQAFGGSGKAFDSPVVRASGERRSERMAEHALLQVAAVWLFS